MNKSYELLDGYFFNKNTSVFFYSLIQSLVLGLLFSPFSSGAKYYAWYLLTNEILILYVTRMNPTYWSIYTRASVMAAGFFGYILGRTIFNFKNPLDGNEINDSRGKKIKDILLSRRIREIKSKIYAKYKN